MIHDPLASVSLTCRGRTVRLPLVAFAAFLRVPTSVLQTALSAALGFSEAKFPASGEPTEGAPAEQTQNTALQKQNVPTEPSDTDNSSVYKISTETERSVTEQNPFPTEYRETEQNVQTVSVAHTRENDVAKSFARVLAITLGDPASASVFERLVQTYPRSLLEEALRRTQRIPLHRISKSRAAVFVGIVRKLSAKTHSHSFSPYA